MENNEPVSKKFSELNPELQTRIFQILLIERDKNQHLYLVAVERAINALFLLNSGGVVTVLAYMNHLGNSVSINCFLIWSLIIFLIGIISALIVVVIDFLVLLDHSNKFNKDIQKYMENNISYNEIRQFKYHKFFYFSVFLGFFSLICIISGIGLGMTGYFYN